MKTIQATPTTELETYLRVSASVDFPNLFAYSAVKKGIEAELAERNNEFKSFKGEDESGKLADLQQEYNNLEERMDTLSDENTSLERNVDRLESTIEELKKDRERRDDTISDLEAQLKQAREQ